MSSICRRLFCCASVALLLACMLSAPAARASSVTVTPIGTPTWQLVDFVTFSADIGNAADNYAEFFALGGKILPEPNHKNYPNVGIGPGAPHGPPYDTEISQGVTNLGISDQTVFPQSDFTNGRGVNLAFMVVAGGSQTGSSPEFASGPIIPNALFPLHVELRDIKDGVDFSEPGALDVPTHTTLDPAFANLDGTSHLPFFFFDNFDFAKDPSKPVAGDYALAATITDTAGNGYSLSAPFTIEGATSIPLPVAFWPGIVLLASIPAARKLRRR